MFLRPITKRDLADKRDPTFGLKSDRILLYDVYKSVKYDIVLQLLKRQVNFDDESLIDFIGKISDDGASLALLLEANLSSAVITYLMTNKQAVATLIDYIKDDMGQFKIHYNLFVKLADVCEVMYDFKKFKIIGCPHNLPLKIYILRHLSKSQICVDDTNIEKIVPIMLEEGLFRYKQITMTKIYEEYKSYEWILHNIAWQTLYLSARVFLQDYFPTIITIDEPDAPMNYTQMRRIIANDRPEELFPKLLKDFNMYYFLPNILRERCRAAYIEKFAKDMSFAMHYIKYKKVAFRRAILNYLRELYELEYYIDDLKNLLFDSHGTDRNFIVQFISRANVKYPKNYHKEQNRYPYEYFIVNCIASQKLDLNWVCRFSKTAQKNILTFFMRHRILCVGSVYIIHRSIPRHIKLYYEKQLASQKTDRYEKETMHIDNKCVICFEKDFSKLYALSCCQFLQGICSECFIHIKNNSCPTCRKPTYQTNVKLLIPACDDYDVSQLWNDTPSLSDQYRLTD